jgi:hypothetical protein
MEIVLGLVLWGLILWGVYVLVRKSVRRFQGRQRLSNEQKQTRGELRSAEKQLKRVTKDHEGAVKQARKAVDELENPKPLAKLKIAPDPSSIGIRETFKGNSGPKSYVLHSDRIVTPSGTHPLEPGVTATVDTAGAMVEKSRSTLTRMGVGTAIAGPLGFMVGMGAKKSKVQDKRELYMLIEGPTWADSMVCKPDDGAKVRQFCTAVNLAARTVEQAKAQRETALATARLRLDEVTTNREAIEGAEAQLRVVSAQHAELMPGEPTQT